MTAATQIPTWVGGRLMPFDKIEAHRAGLKHKAVSVFIRDGDAILLQQRAAQKYHTPGRWANACCTHPHWDEPAGTCALRRLDEELGVTGVALRHAGQVEYRADVGGGMTEHEVVEIFVGEARRDLPLRPDPAEVSATRWADLASLRAEVPRNPAAFTPWLRIYLADHAEMIFGPASGADADRR